MPRKKRKSCVNKEPLLFTESPISKQRNVPTPVYCARHPTTAQSIPVEDCITLSWVSPQFKSVPSSIGGQRRTRNRRFSHTNSEHQKPCTCQGSTSAEAPSRHGRKKSKFKPLVFEGDITPCQTVIQDVDITEDIDDDIENSHPVFHKKSKGKHCDERDLSQISIPTPTQALDDSDQNFVLHDDPPVKKLFNDLSGSTQNEKRRSKQRTKPRSHISRIFQNLDMSLCATSSPHGKSRVFKVFVPDTPEADYGFSNKERKLRRGRHFHNSFKSKISR